MSKKTNKLTNDQISAKALLDQIDDYITTSATELDKDAIQDFQEARKLLNELGQKDDSLEEQFNNANTKISAILFNKAQALQQQKEYDKAIECYDQAIEIKSTLSDSNPIKKAGLAALFNGQGKATFFKAYLTKELDNEGKSPVYDESITSLEKSLTLKLEIYGENPQEINEKAALFNSYSNLTNSYLNKGVIIQSLGNNYEAIQYFEQAMESVEIEAKLKTASNYQARLDSVSGKVTVSYVKEAISLKNSGSYEESIDLYIKALESNSKLSNEAQKKGNFAAIYNNLGDTLEANQEYDSALLCYSKSIEMKKDLYGDNPKPNEKAAIERTEKHIETLESKAGVDITKINHEHDKLIDLLIEKDSFDHNDYLEAKDLLGITDEHHDTHADNIN